VSEWDSDEEQEKAEQAPQQQQDPGNLEPTYEVPPGMLTDVQEHALHIRTSAAHQMGEIEAYRKQHCHYYKYFDGWETVYRRDHLEVRSHLQDYSADAGQSRARIGTFWPCSRRCRRATKSSLRIGAGPYSRYEHTVRGFLSARAPTQKTRRKLSRTTATTTRRISSACRSCAPSDPCSSSLCSSQRNASSMASRSRMPPASAITGTR